MASIGTAITQHLHSLLTAPNGAGSVNADSTFVVNAAAELAERNSRTSYPSIYIYCDRVTNKLTEKFRTFSGMAHAVIEVRHSLDRIDGIDAALQGYVDSVLQILDGSRGVWGGGCFYTGGYDVMFGAVKAGGRQFLQVAKIGFEVEVSR